MIASVAANNRIQCRAREGRSCAVVGSGEIGIRQLGRSHIERSHPNPAFSFYNFGFSLAAHRQCRSTLTTVGFCETAPMALNPPDLLAGIVATVIAGQRSVAVR